MKKYTEIELEKMFDAYLDDVLPPVKISIYEYPVSRAFREIDPIAYNEEFKNWMDSEGLEIDETNL